MKIKSSVHHPERVIGIFFLSMINVAAILSIKNWPLTSSYGLGSIFYYVFAAIFFFLPVSFISAELASGWPQRGGVFVWVKEAMGPRWAFLAIWLLWFENIVYYPTVLSFITATIAYMINPHLSENPTYMFITTLICFWGATWINLRGMKTSGWISSIGVIIGTFLPGLLIIFLGFLWIFHGNPIAMSVHAKDLIPDFSKPTHLSLIAGVMLGLAGMEMSAVHARDVKNPKQNYPKAIFLSALIIIGLSILGTLSISLVVPANKLSLVAGGMEAISIFLNAHHLSWLIPVISFLIAIGAFGTMSTWLVGPSKGLLAAANEGEFPPLFHKVNARDMPVAMMILQAIVVTIISTLFLFVPDVSSSFWMFVALASQIYLIMYVMMFISAIILKYKKPHVERTYNVPGGKIGLCLVASIGILGALFIFILGFFPPQQLSFQSTFFYELFLILGIILVCIIPRIILLFKKPNWNKNHP